jgi:hypothetical protein
MILKLSSLKNYRDIIDDDIINVGLSFSFGR